MWGFITVMNDILINTFGSLFHLKPTELSYIQLSFFGTFFVVSITYFLISTLSGKDPINLLGYKNGISLSLLICGLGCGFSYMASLNESYPQFIISLFILSTGVTLLQICANPYATILGPESAASSRLNLAQGFNSLGTTIGPIVGNILIYSVFSNGDKSIESVGKTYLLYGIIFLLFAVLVLMSKLPAFVNEQKFGKGASVLQERHVRFGMIAIFFYVGSEVSIGSWIGRFGQDESIMGLSEQAANHFLAFFWGGLMIGRLVGSVSMNESLLPGKKITYMTLISLGVFAIIWLATGVQVKSIDGHLDVSLHLISLKQIWIYLLFMCINLFAFVLGKGKPARLIIIFCAINSVLLLFGIFGSGAVAFWSILGTGLFFSIGWSNIFSLSIKGLGNRTSQGSSLLVMAIVGGAVLPYLQSTMIEYSTVQLSFLIPLIGMAYLIFFGVSGYKPSNIDKPV